MQLEVDVKEEEEEERNVFLRKLFASLLFITVLMNNNIKDRLNINIDLRHINQWQASADLSPGCLSFLARPATAANDLDCWALKWQESR